MIRLNPPSKIHASISPQTPLLSPASNPSSTFSPAFSLPPLSPYGTTSTPGTSIASSRPIFDNTIFSRSRASTNQTIDTSIDHDTTSVHGPDLSPTATARSSLSGYAASDSAYTADEEEFSPLIRVSHVAERCLYAECHHRSAYSSISDAGCWAWPTFTIFIDDSTHTDPFADQYAIHKVLEHPKPVLQSLFSFLRLFLCSPSVTVLRPKAAFARQARPPTRPRFDLPCYGGGHPSGYHTGPSPLSHPELHPVTDRTAHVTLPAHCHASNPSPTPSCSDAMWHMDEIDAAPIRRVSAATAVRAIMAGGDGMSNAAAA